MAALTWRRLTRGRDHRWAQPRISEYVDGELALGERQRLAEHEEICSDCARLVLTLEALLAILPTLQLPPAASFEIAERTTQRVRARIEEWS